MYTMIFENDRKERRKKQKHWVTEMYQRLEQLVAFATFELKTKNTISRKYALYRLNLTHLQNPAIHCNNIYYVF